MLDPRDMAQLTVKTRRVQAEGVEPFLVVCYDKAASEKFGYRALPALTTIKFPRQAAVAAIDYLNGLMLIEATAPQEKAAGDSGRIAWQVQTIEV
jgi:hypothetical protein